MLSDYSFLAGYQLPDPTFASVEMVPDSLRQVWCALRDQDFKRVLILGRPIYRKATLNNTKEQAALTIALARAQFKLGKFEQARHLAEESLRLYKNQWLSHRILNESLRALRNFHTAYELLSNLRVEEPLAPWDEPLTARPFHLALASLAWNLRDWESTARQIHHAYADGLSTMPDELLEDVFRLALYRNRADDAVEVASGLIIGKPVSYRDTVFQTLVQQGWYEQALSLYRAAHTAEPENALFRRRLVGLCIRTGALDEARRLSKNGALDIAA